MIERGFISYKDLSCILRSKRMFRQHVKFHAFSILATELTRLAVCKKVGLTISAKSREVTCSFSIVLERSF